MGNLIGDIVIGLVSGLVSSTLVTLFFNWRAKKKEEAYRFEMDKQIYVHYIQRVRRQLSICVGHEKYDNCEDLIMEIENSPICESFHNLPAAYNEVLNKSRKALNALMEQAQKGDAADPAVYHKYNPILLKTAIPVLKFERVKRKTGDQ